MIVTDENKIKELLTRGVDEVINKEDLEKKLKSGKELRIKLGIDPTSPNIHIGRSIPLLKLRDFQKLGHKVVFIIGDFTGVIGDTSDKDSERPMLDEEKIKENMKNYIDQAAKILDIDKCEIHHNGDWLSKLTYLEITKQTNIFSVNEFISRENISKRLDEGKRVSLREFLYPIMQGYDSVAIRADVELGGTDQRFNVLAGRELQRLYKQEPQNIITNPLIEGLDGRKMSSSWGNTINLFENSKDMFGKIMSLKDEFIIKYFNFVTRVDLKTIEGYEKELKNGVNPRDIKIKLAHELVRMYHNEEIADKEVENFISQFSEHKLPEDIKEFQVSSDQYQIIDLLVETELCSSRTEARKMIEQGAVKIYDKDENMRKVSDINEIIDIDKENIIQVGKLKYIKIVK